MHELKLQTGSILRPVGNQNHKSRHHVVLKGLSPRFTSILRTQKKQCIISATASATEAVTITAKASTGPTSTTSTSESVSSWPCRDGYLCQIFQSTDGDMQSIHIVLSSSYKPFRATPELQWGVFRTSADVWQHPESIIPKDSHVDDGILLSPMEASADNKSYSITMTVPKKMAPLTLAFTFRLANSTKAAEYINPLTGPHFATLIGIGAGTAYPLGASIANPITSSGKNNGAKKQQPKSSSSTAAGETINFAVHTMGADRVHLVLLKPPQDPNAGQQWGSIEIVLDPVINRTGHTWHVAIPNLKGLDKLCYAWRLDGEVSWEKGYRIQPDQLLLDPNAPVVQYIAPSTQAPTSVPLPSFYESGADGPASHYLSSLSFLTSDTRAFKQGVTVGPRRALEDVRALEVDVRSFATGPKVTNPGTYLGVVERLSHIKAVGSNMVVFNPLHATAPSVDTATHRAVVNLFAPDPLLSTNPLDPTVAVTELRSMIDALHAAGIEVILEMDLTFTVEGTDSKPNTMSMRGLDNAAYYRPNGVLNCGHPVVQDMVVRAVRHWSTEYGIDGICFVNAENLVQDRDGVVLDAPPLADALCFDPALSHLKFIAAPTTMELLPRSGVRGFPHWGVWQQRNGSFGRDLMTYIAEGTFFLTAVAKRLSGSADIFEANWEEGMPGNLAAGRRPAFGFNAVSALGRTNLLTLAREAAGVAAAAAAREGSLDDVPSAKTVAKTLLAAVALSQGTPYFTQEDVADVEFARFVGVLLRLRRQLGDLLIPPLFESPRSVYWHSASGAEPEWEACSLDAVASEGSSFSSCNYLAFSVQQPEGGKSVYVGINPHPHQVVATLPAPPLPGHNWVRAVDTSLSAPEDAVLEGFVEIHGGQYGLGPKGFVVLMTAPVSM